MLEQDHFLATLLGLESSKSVLAAFRRYINRLCLAKCCEIQQLAHSYSTIIFMFNKIYLYSTFYVYIQQYAFSFNFNPNYFHSTKIFVQLQPKIISFNKNNASINSSGAHPPPPRATAGQLLMSSVPGVGHKHILLRPGGWALAYPGRSPGHLTHAFSIDG